jgi:hypothetical protein
MSSAVPRPSPPRMPEVKFDALDENNLHPLVNEQTASDIWVLLVVFRCANALLVWTFFQPDEYFQSLEPAWRMAFGAHSGAWITWACASPPAAFILLTEPRSGSINFAHHCIRLCLPPSITWLPSLWSSSASSLCFRP